MTIAPGTDYYSIEGSNVEIVITEVDPPFLVFDTLQDMLQSIMQNVSQVGD